MEDPSFPDSYKRAKWKTAPQGAKNEYYYEKYFRNPTRTALGGTATDILHPYNALRHLGTPQPISPVAGKAASYVTPQDLESAGIAAGGTVGSVTGHPFLGAEIGGTIGGSIQGKNPAAAAAEAVPSALLNRYVPKALRKMFATRIAQQMSNKVSSVASKSAAKLFNYLGDVPSMPTELQNFFGTQLEGKLTPAMERAGKRLGAVRNYLVNQPNLKVKVPIEAEDGTVQDVEMSMKEALDNLERYYKRGFSASDKARNIMPKKPVLGSAPGGFIQQRVQEIQNRLNSGAQRIRVPIGPQGGTKWISMDRVSAQNVMQRYIQSAAAKPAAPSGVVLPPSDQDLAKMLRSRISSAISNGISKKFGDYYDKVSADYGTAAAMRRVFKPNVITPEGLMNHENLYRNAAHPDASSHLANNVGAQAVRQFQGEIFPGGQRIQPGQASHFSFHTPMVPMRAGVNIAGAPTGPFAPKWPGASGVIGSTAASQVLENLTGGGE